MRQAGIVGIPCAHLGRDWLDVSAIPSLAELGESGAYSLEIWRIVSECLAAVSDEAASIIEPLVLVAISPTVNNQAMLGTATIRRRIKAIVGEHEPSARPKDPDEEPLPGEDGEDDWGGAEQPALRLDIDERPDETTDFYLSLPKLEATELTAALDNVRLKEDCSRAEALMKLIRGGTKAEINLNLYRRVDLPDSTIWAAGGWLTPMATEEWLKRVTHIQAPGKASNEDTRRFRLFGRALRGVTGPADSPAVMCRRTSASCTMCSDTTTKTLMRAVLRTPRIFTAYARSITMRRRQGHGM